jgi:N-acetylglucosaminyl-diphospho-decaprenol L-rhamnosyltransferase
MVTGCLLLSPRSVWDELGGLDEHFFVYGEDADYAARARAIGYRTIITPDAEVIHAIGVSSGGGIGRTTLLMAAKISYLRRHFDGPEKLLIIALFRLGALAPAAVSKATGRGGKWADAWSRRHYWWIGFRLPPDVRSPYSRRIPTSPTQCRRRQTGLRHPSAD